MVTIYFDMDGTLADLYGVENWLDYLLAGDTFPYATARPMHNFSALARLLHKAQVKGFAIGVISWLCRDADAEYDEKVTAVKKAWLAKHLPSVKWDEIIITTYGTPKENYACAGDILFDDEEKNRNNWTGEAFAPSAIMEFLRSI